MNVPFHCVAVDLIGPITPVSNNVNRNILTIVDFATKYPEAVVVPRLKQRGLLKLCLMYS